MPSFRGKEVDVVVDVRSRIEFFLGHLPGAVCIPVQGVVAGLARRGGVTPDTRILVYCASGKRSAAAAAELERSGYRQVVDGGGLGPARAEFRG